MRLLDPLSPLRPTIASFKPALLWDLRRLSAKGSRSRSSEGVGTLAGGIGGGCAGVAGAGVVITSLVRSGDATVCGSQSTTS